MKKAMLIGGAFLAYVVLFTLAVMIYFYGTPNKDKYIGTSITTQEGASLRKIQLTTCSGEGDLFLYEGDPFQDLDTSFENSGNQVLIFTRDNLESVEIKANGNKVIPAKLADNVFSFEAAYGALISVEGDSADGARSIQGYLSQDAGNPVYETSTFQYVYDDERRNEMFLIPGEYSYAFFDKYTINKKGAETDTRKLTVKVEGNGAIILEKTYTQPYPEGTEGAVVDSFRISDQGNYTLSIQTEDSVYWALVTCPVCGNGEMEKNEQCDAGADNGRECEPEYGQECEYCSSVCELVSVGGAFCGDNKINGEEQCDNGSDNGKICFPEYGQQCSYCSLSCQEVVVDGSSCGDGNIDEGEQCDDGSQNGGGCVPEPGKECSYCSQQCEVVTNQGAFCGDGEINQDSEQCDDGNNLGGDGCSFDCKIEKEEPKVEPMKEEKDCGGSIGNYVWNDANADGVQDSSEPGIAKIRMKLEWAGPDGDFGNSDDEEFRTDTDSKGRYIFEDLCKGKYKVVVKEEDVNSYIQTYDPDGKLDNETKVTLKSDKEDHTKADFGYQKRKVAPAAGLNFVALLAISASLTAFVLIAYEVLRLKKKRAGGRK